MLGERRLEQVDLLVDGAFSGRSFERRVDVELFRRLLYARLNGLPELVLEALADDSDVGLVGGQRNAGRAEQDGDRDDADQSAFGKHGSSVERAVD